MVCFRSLFSQVVTQKYKNSQGKEGKQTSKRQEYSTNRRYNHFSGSTHSFGFFSSNSDTYLTPWTESCWLSGGLSRNTRDTESANAAKARGQKWSWAKKTTKNQAEWRNKPPIYFPAAGDELCEQPAAGRGQRAPAAGCGRRCRRGAREPSHPSQTDTRDAARKNDLSSRE